MARPGWQFSNEGKPQGQKKPFEPVQVTAIASLLRSQGKTRDLAIWLTLICTALRVGDLCRLRVSHVVGSDGNVRAGFRVVQSKLAGENTNIGKRKPTNACVDVSLEPAAIAALTEHIASAELVGDVLLFPVTPCRVRQLIKSWAKSVGIKGDDYSCHSTRRTATTLVYRATLDYERVRILCGHTSLRHTSCYLGISREDSHTSKHEALSFLK